MKKMMSEFKDFILRGNVMDMAVGIIIGVAFGAIVTSLVNDVIMPPIGLLLGNIDFSNLYINLSGTDYASLSDARAAGAPLIAYGAFINTIINFLIIALVIFLMIRFINNMVKMGKKREEAAAAADPTTRECPFCLSTIAIKATRCPQCTSQLDVK